MTVDRSALAALQLEAAHARYLSSLEALAAIRPCSAAWPGDPRGPGYLGTTCQLLDGHVQRDGTGHRHRVLGTQVTLEWP